MKTRNHGLDEREMELVKLLMADCKSTGDIQDKLKKLFAGTIEQMLEAEMDEHLGYEKNSVEGNNSGNSRNGYGKKTISSDYGDCEIAVPRDRNGEFEPKVIEKRQTRTDEIEQKIMSMYAKGMSQRDIEDTLREIYGSDISQGMISKITDRILPEVNEWQNRPLDKIYPVIFFDGIVFNSRKDNKIISKCVYSVLGINMEGQKEILALQILQNALILTMIFRKETLLCTRQGKPQAKRYNKSHISPKGCFLGKIKISKPRYLRGLLINLLVTQAQTKTNTYLPIMHSAL